MIFCKIQKRTCLLFQLQSGQNCQLQNCTFKTLTASFLIQSLDLCYITIFKSEFYLGNYKWVKSTSFQHLHDYFAYHKERRFTKKKTKQWQLDIIRTNYGFQISFNSALQLCKFNMGVLYTFQKAYGGRFIYFCIENW